MLDSLTMLLNFLGEGLMFILLLETSLLSVIQKTLVSSKEEALNKKNVCGSRHSDIPLGTTAACCHDFTAFLTGQVLLCLDVSVTAQSICNSQSQQVLKVANGMHPSGLGAVYHGQKKCCNNI